MLVMLSEGGEAKLGTNINFLLEEFGIALNNGTCTLICCHVDLTMTVVSDAVTRMAYYKFFHPKEALITTGVLNRELARAAGHTPNDTMATTTPQRYHCCYIVVI